LILLGIAISYTNQCIFAIILLASYCAVRGVCYELIKEKKCREGKFIRKNSTRANRGDEGGVESEWKGHIHSLFLVNESEWLGKETKNYSSIT
jgi:hypothetical protein